MKIEQIEIRGLCLPLVRHFETSFGRSEEKHTIIVKVSSGRYVGYGECPASKNPYYCYQTAATCRIIIEEYLGPLLLRSDISSPSELPELFGRIRGYEMAKAGVECAVWDLYARIKGEPVARLLGGVKERIPAGVSIGIQDSVEELLDTVGSFLEKGYKKIKVKIKPGWDDEILEEIRKAFGDIPLMADANAAYSSADFDHLASLDRFNLLMLEQPLRWDDLLEHAKLQKRMDTPICLDESITSPEGAMAALELGSCRVINIKPARVGGPTLAKRIHDICQDAGVPVWCGGLLETGIGRVHNIAMASLPNFKYPGDISESRRYYSPDIIEPEVVVDADGMIAVPQGLGIGVRVDEEAMERRTIWKSLVH